LLLTSDDGSIREVFDRAEIVKWVNDHSVAPEGPRNVEAIRLLDKVCRVMLRQHMIKDHQSDLNGRLLQDPMWQSIESILVKAHLVDRIRTKATGGAKASFLRMRDPFRVLVSDDESVRSVWDAVGAIE
jgi:hypothetical protein